MLPFSDWSNRVVPCGLYHHFDYDYHHQVTTVYREVEFIQHFNVCDHVLLCDQVKTEFNRGIYSGSPVDHDGVHDTVQCAR